MTDETENGRISRLTEAVRRAAEGDFSFHYGSSGENDEVDALAAEFRRMAEVVRQNIAGRKSAEDAQRHCEEKYRRLKANIPGFVYLYAMHPDGSISFPYVNDASRDLFDISPEELMADASLLTRLIHPDDRERFASSAKRSAETLEPWREEVRLIVNGEVRWYDCIYRPELQPNGDILWDGINLEITERKRIEEALQQANLVVENSSVVLFRWRAAEGWPVELVSRNVTQFGYAPEEFLSGALPFASIINPQDLERVAAEVKKYADQGVDNFQQEYRLVKKNGDMCWVYDRTVIERDAGGKIAHYQGIIIDITERKRMEQDLLLTKYCVDHAGIGIYHTSEQHIYNANDFACKSLGYTVEELRAMSVFDIDPVVTMEKINQIGRILEMCGTATHQTTHRRKDGTTFPVEITTNMVEFQGKHYGISFVKDITERKQAEETLRFTQYAVDNAFSQAFWVKPDGSIFYVNNAACRSLGYSREELLGMTIPDIDPTFPTEVFAQYWRELKEKGYMILETRQRARDGRVYPVEVSSNYVVFGDNEYNCAFVTDITDRKQAQEALRKSEEKFRVLTETSPAAIMMLQGERIIYANPAITRISGYTAAELSHLSFWDCFHEDFREMARERGLARQRGESVPGQYESQIITKEGERRWVVVSGAPIKYGEKPTSIVTLLDITEAKQAEEKLRLSEEILSSAFRTSPDSININRLRDGLYLEVNKGFSAITGYTAEEVVGKTAEELNIWVHREDRALLVRELNRNGSVSNLEAEFRRKDGSILIGQMSARVIEIEGIPCIINIVRDITDRRRADEQIRASLAEKEILLKEVHHRVKNNLQIISTLLDLQSDSIDGEKALLAFRESQDRIRAMALVHEMLYESKDLASIDFAEYIEKLAYFLFNSYMENSERITLKVDVGHLPLEIDSAIPCGLIINELVSNALKHAFPDRRKGEITIRLDTGEDGSISLLVSDNGVGLPAGMDFRETSTLGLQLVNMLTKQLHGRIELSGDQGASWEITFSPMDNVKSA